MNITPVQVQVKGESSITGSILEEEYPDNGHVCCRRKNASFRVDSGSVPSYLVIQVLQDRSDFSLQLLAEESDNFRARATIQDN